MAHSADAVMEGVHYELETETQFWGELDEILSPVGLSVSEMSVEKAVHNFIAFAAAFRGNARTCSYVDLCRGVFGHE